MADHHDVVRIRVDSLIQSEYEKRQSRMTITEKAKPLKIFISHASEDREFVESELIPVLSSHGVETWYSKDDIHGSDQWERRIVEGLKSCDWFMLVMSPNSALSEWVKDEVNWAFQNRMDRITPVFFEDCDSIDFHIRMPRLHHVDYRFDRAEARKNLLNVWGIEETGSELEQLLDDGDLEKIRKWSRRHPDLLKGAISPMWRPAEVLPEFTILDVTYDLAFMYDDSDFGAIEIVKLGKPNLKEQGYEIIYSEGKEIASLKDWRKSHRNEALRAVCNNLNDLQRKFPRGNFGSWANRFEMIADSDESGIAAFLPAFITVFFAGRREEYDSSMNLIRNQMKDEHKTTIASYDRILDFIRNTKDVNK